MSLVTIQIIQDLTGQLDGEDDKSILIYDRYDIWEFSPDGSKSKRLTKGREDKNTFMQLQFDIYAVNT